VCGRGAFEGTPGSRAGKLTFVDDEARERYEAMKRVGLFGS
jgi:hypothetical protein